MKKNIFSYIYLILFLFVIALIYLGQILGISSANDFIERRSIAKFPKISFSRDFVVTLNDYLGDNFGFRNILLKQYLTLKFNLLKTHKINHADFNDEGWIFGEISPGSDYERIYKKSSYSIKQLNNWKEIFEKEKEHLDKQDIPYFVVIIPDRRIVYKELLPFQENLAFYRHNQFINFMKKYSNVDVIDTTEALIKAKNRYPLFFKTDSHWTNYGAFAAYQEIIKKIKKNYPEAISYEEKDFDIQLEKYKIWLGDGGFIYSGNLGRPEHNVRFYFKGRVQNPKLFSVLTYGDSFMNIDRRICHLCFLKEFPEMEPLIWSLFAAPSSDKLLDPNPGYILPKMRLEEMIPLIRTNIADKKVQERIINYLTAQAIHPDLIGLNYFLKLNFQKIVARDLTSKLAQELIDEYKPNVVIREAIDNRIWEFDRLKCNYDANSSFTDTAECKTPFY